MLKRTESSGKICPKTALAGPAFMAKWTQALWAVLIILSSKVNTFLSVQISRARFPLSQFTRNISLLPHPNRYSVFPLSISLIWLPPTLCLSPPFNMPLNFHSLEEIVSRLRENILVMIMQKNRHTVSPFYTLMVQYASVPLSENSWHSRHLLYMASFNIPINKGQFNYATIRCA